MYWVFRKTCPVSNQTCLIVPLGTCRLNCKRKLLKDASSILTCYIAIVLHLTPAVLKKERVLKEGGSSAQGICSEAGDSLLTATCPQGPASCHRVLWFTCTQMYGQDHTLSLT